MATKRLARTAIEGVASLTPKKLLKVTAVRPDGTAFAFQAVARVDTPVEVDYLRHGGILPAVLRQICRS